MIATLAPWLSSLPPLAAYPPTGWRITRLGGLTNRNYRLQQAGQDLLLRLPGAATGRFIDRAVEAHNTARAAALGLCPAVIYAEPASGVRLSRYVADARPLTAADCGDADILRRIAGLLARLHASGADFQGRVTLDSTLAHYQQLAAPLAPEVDALLAATAPLRQALASTREDLLPCHLDPHPGNFLITPGGQLTLIDWEYSGLGEPLWDLATLAAGAELDQADAERLLHYHDPTTSPARLHRLPLYRGMLDLLGALWWYAHYPQEPQAAYPRERLARLRRLLASVHLDARTSEKIDYT